MAITLDSNSGWRWLALIVASTGLGVPAARADSAPTTTMNTGDAGSRAASVTEMMGAPGLVPFEIMTGQAGKWMVGYQFMLEKMDGNLVGSADISEARILQRFFAAPTEMTMQMHMGMVMYAPTDKLTLMATLPYTIKQMDHWRSRGR